MKPFLYWFLGERAGRVTVGLWAWLVGQPIEAGDRRAVAIAQQSVDDVAGAVEAMTKAVSQQYAALQQADALFETMQAQQRDLEHQAERLVQSDDESTALAVLAELEVIEAALPQIEAQVEAARRNFTSGKAQLSEKQRQLKQMKLQQKVDASLQRVTAALEQASALSGLSSDSAVNTFTTAHDAVNRRAVAASAQSEMQSLGQEAQRKTAQLKAADRLKALKAKMAEPSSETSSTSPGAPRRSPL
ncbi:MAG: hypothetical protein AAF289_16125 [Cyanobacteria bacterium P01_A01_bin.135]